MGGGTPGRDPDRGAGVRGAGGRRAGPHALPRPAAARSRRRAARGAHQLRGARGGRAGARGRAAGGTGVRDRGREVQDRRRRLRGRRASPRVLPRGPARQVLRRALAHRARPVRRGGEVAQGDPGARRRPRARPRPPGARLALPAQRAGRQGGRGLSCVRHEPLRQPAARPRAHERGADARGRAALPRGARDLPPADGGVPGERLRLRRPARAPSTSRPQAELAWP